jgi:hypothetical protein
MTLLNQALQAGRRAAPADAAIAASVVVAGGGGALGSAVLERLLGSRHFAPVKVLATRRFTAAMHGLELLVVADGDGDAPHALEPPAPPPARPLAEFALIVFDRARAANGRERAFLRPQPDTLAELARWLRGHGVQRLIVVLPHAPARLPDALKAGLANLDEQAVAALGFEHLVFVRSAQPPADARANQWLQRVADGMLAQLQMMVAASNQPVRAAKVAQFVVELAAQLGSSAPGTRVAPPELVWQAAQLRDPAALVGAWLAARELPPLRAPRRRL